MNVLFISSDNSKTSGAFLCLAELCKQLQENYNVNILVVLPYDGDGKPILDSYNIRSVVVKSCTWAVPMEWNEREKLIYKIKMLIYNIPAIHTIRKIIRKEKTDIVHINTSWSYVGGVAAVIERKKLIWHIRELLKQQQRSIAFEKMGNKLMRKADSIITVSKFIKDSYSEIFKKKIKVIYDGVEEDKYYCERDILRNDIVSILSVGGIIKQKGQDQALKSIKILRDLGTNNIELNIVGRGEGEYKDYLERYVKKEHLENYINFCGSTSSPEFFYRKSDIFVMSSHSEAFGRTTAEAMLSGCVVIGAESGATPELINYGKYGMLYSHGNPNELAKQIKYLIENKDKARIIAKNGQSNARQSYTIKRNADNIFSLYKKCLEKKIKSL